MMKKKKTRIWAAPKKVSAPQFYEGNQVMVAYDTIRNELITSLELFFDARKLAP